MARGLCPAVRTLDQCLRSAIPFLNGQFTDAGVNKQSGNRKNPSDAEDKGILELQTKAV